MPTDKSGVQRFLGICQYLSKFCHNLSETVLPLRDLTKENSIFKKPWKRIQLSQESHCISDCATPLQSCPSRNPVDASEDAIGGVLLQNDQPVCFTSHRLKNTEKNYAQIEIVCLAIVSCMDKRHQYLYRTHDITVHADHQPFETIFQTPLSKAPTSANHAKTTKISVFSSSRVYNCKKGTELCIADTFVSCTFCWSPFSIRC